MRHAVALVALLVLAACGGSGASESPDGGGTVLVIIGPTPGRQARAEWSGTVATVTVERAAGPSTVGVLIHEFLHVALRSGDHIDDPSCYLHWTAMYAPPTLCPAEAALFAAVTGTWAVTIADAELEPYAAEAAAFLNREAGRTVFLLP